MTRKDYLFNRHYLFRSIIWKLSKHWVWTFSTLQVVAKVNNGRGEFMVSVKPKTSLCDGVFHKISGETSLKGLFLFCDDYFLYINAMSVHISASLTVSSVVIKRLHVVQLSVDTMDNYKIGPPTSTPILTKSPLFLGGIPGECPKMYKIPNLPHKL